MVSGTGRICVFAASQSARTRDFRAGDVGYIPRSMGQYIENTGNTDLVFLEVFRSSYYSSISFAQWLSHMPPELVKAHFKFSDDTLKSFSRDKVDVNGA